MRGPNGQYSAPVVTKREFRTVRIVLHPLRDGRITLNWSFLAFRGWQEPRTLEGGSVTTDDASLLLDAISEALACARAASHHED